MARRVSGIPDSGAINSAPLREADAFANVFRDPGARVPRREGSDKSPGATQKDLARLKNERAFTGPG